MADQKDCAAQTPLDEEALREVVGGTGTPLPVRLPRPSPSYAGQTLAAKGGTDVSMESLTLTYEKFEP